MKKAWKNFIISMKPTYAVEFTMYHVVPGTHVKKNAERHQFGKGSLDEAKDFYNKVVNKTSQIKLAPAEVHLIKGKKRVIQKKYFGPVDQVKQMKISA